MSVSIDYSAAVLRRNSIGKELEEYLQTGRGLNWESFCLYPAPRPGYVLEGATRHRGVRSLHVSACPDSTGHTLLRCGHGSRWGALRP